MVLRGWLTSERRRSCSAARSGADGPDEHAMASEFVKDATFHTRVESAVKEGFGSPFAQALHKKRQKKARRPRRANQPKTVTRIFRLLLLMSEVFVGRQR